MHLRFTVALFVLALQLPTFAQEGAPPPQQFGPDSQRTGVFTGTETPGLSCNAPPSRARTCTGYLSSAVDGTFLDVTVQVPDGNGPHPLVVILHGWGGSKGSSGDIADPFAAEGYAVLRYSARGFGQSWGQVNLADIHVELEDLRSMIGQVVDHPQLRINGDAVGITGVSYGGGQSWLALLQPAFISPKKTAVRIRTVVPIVPWSDLLYSLLPNGRPQFSLAPPGSPKLSYINALYLGGLRDSPARPYPNYPDYLAAWHAWLNGTEPNSADPVFQQIRDGTAGYRSIWWQGAFWEQALKHLVPVFQVQGFTDDLFPLSEAKRMLLALKSIDPNYPIASYFGDLGHPRASNKTDELDYVLRLVRQWFDWYLKGVGVAPQHVIHAAITRPRDQAFRPTDVITVGSYADLATTVVSKAFQEQAQIINPVDDPYSGFVWDPVFMEAARELEPLPAPPDPALVPSAAAVYNVRVADLTAANSLLIAGQPTVLLRGTTTAPRVQLNVRLIEVAPGGRRELVTRGTFILETAPGAFEVVIPTYGNLWEAAANSMLRLEITTLDSPYIAPSRVASTTTISQVRLDITAR